MKTLAIIRRSSNIHGGIEKQICLIANRLKNSNLIIPVLVTTNSESKFASNFRDLGLKVYDTKEYGSYSIKNIVRRLEDINNFSQIIAIQSHTFKESIAASYYRLKHRNIKHVFRVHTYIDASFIPQWKKTSYHLLAWISSPFVDIYIPINELASRELIKKSHISPQKIHKIPNICPAIGTPDILSDKSDSYFPRQLAMVGNLVPKKGHDVLLDAVKILCDDDIRIKANIIGADDASPDNIQIKQLLENQATTLNISDLVNFHGHIDDIPGALDNIPIVVLPSESEGTPNSLLEAMSLKKLVIASNVGGIPELIRQNITGILHPKNDPQALAEILKDVFTTPSSNWDAIRAQGFNTWKTDYEGTGIFEHFRAAYNSIGIEI